MLIVVDFEATCKEERDSVFLEKQEIIEIGLCSVDEIFLDTIHKIDLFVKPVFHSQLTPFCTSLTTITQNEVDKGFDLAAAMEVCSHFIDYEKDIFCSWGNFDKNLLSRNLHIRGLSEKYGKVFPRRHVNIKQFVADYDDARPCGIKAKCAELGIVFEGTLHRAIDDAINVVAILRAMQYQFGASTSEVGQKLIEYAEKGYIPLVSQKGIKNGQE